MLKRITKRQARKLFEAGEDIILLPCKCDPNNPYQNKFGRKTNIRKLHNISYPSNYKGYHIKTNYVSYDDFDGIVLTYEFQFCDSKENGRYAAYYIGNFNSYLNNITGLSQRNVNPNIPEI